MSMHHEEHWLSILELGPEATETEISNAYRELVKVWHPDRFESDPILRKKAEAKLRDINVAYEKLRGYQPPPRRASAPESTTQANGSIDRAAEAADRRISSAWLFASVSVATAAIVGALLYFGMPREAVATGDEVKVAPEPPLARKAGTARPSQPRPEEVPAPERPTTGMVTVFSQPTGATVFLDDQRVGGTPLNLTEVPPGEHRIRLELDGYPAWSSPVIVEAGGAEKLLAILERKRPARD
jgi:hypothetical protein